MYGSEEAKAAFLEEIVLKLNLKGRQVGGRRRVRAGPRIKARLYVCRETVGWLVVLEDRESAENS